MSSLPWPSAPTRTGQAPGHGLFLWLRRVTGCAAQSLYEGALHRKPGRLARKSSRTTTARPRRKGGADAAAGEQAGLLLPPFFRAGHREQGGVRSLPDYSDRSKATTRRHVERVHFFRTEFTGQHFDKSSDPTSYSIFGGPAFSYSTISDAKIRSQLNRLKPFFDRCSTASFLLSLSLPTFTPACIVHLLRQSEFRVRRGSHSRRAVVPRDTIRRP